MRSRIIAVLALSVLAATWAGAKNWAKELDSRDAEKRARAARELSTKALAQGLSDDDIEALAAAVDDASEEVQARVVTALAANTDIGTSQYYAPYFAGRGDNLVAFLLWYSVYQTYSRIIYLSGREGGGDMRDEMAYARKEAERAFANMLDPERKRRAQPYYDALTK